MKKLALLFVLLMCLSVFAQNIDNEKDIDKQKAQTSQINWGPYMKDLELRIKRNWTPPRNSTSKSVVVTFTIGRDGKLLDNKITKSSEDEVNDKNALQAIEKTAPFRPLPEGFEGSSVTVEFTFDYNIINTVMGGTYTYNHTRGTSSYHIGTDDNNIYIKPSSDIFLWLKSKGERRKNSEP